MQFSTETLISDACELIERVRYEAYGKARHGWAEDLDGNGSFVEADRNIGIATPAGKTIGEGAYNVLMDFDFRGTIEQDEYDRCQSGTGIAALDAGAITDPDFDDGPWSPAGYDGYIYDDIADLSCVRFRWYDAGLGRWMTRDPAGYVDGASVYLYVNALPQQWIDGTGTQGTQTYERFEGGDPMTCPTLCGPDITAWLEQELAQIVAFVAQYWRAVGDRNNFLIHEGREPELSTDWDIRYYAIRMIGRRLTYFPNTTFIGNKCPGEKCPNTVTIAGKCWHTSEVGNFVFGYLAAELGADEDFVLWGAKKIGNRGLWTPQDRASILLGLRMGGTSLDVHTLFAWYGETSDTAALGAPGDCEPCDDVVNPAMAHIALPALTPGGRLDPLTRVPLIVRP